jgi:hypothetical protein
MARGAIAPAWRALVATGAEKRAESNSSHTSN